MSPCRLGTAVKLFGMMAVLSAGSVGSVWAQAGAGAGSARSSGVSATTAESRIVEAGEIYPGSSRVYIFVGKTGLGHEHAVVGQIKHGAIRLGDARNPGEIVFAMETFVADTDAARKFIGLEGTKDASAQQQVTANMVGPDVLDVRRFPTATFAIKSAQPLAQNSKRGRPQVQLDGDFTLHGTTRPIQVVTEVEEADGWLHLRGGFSILQTQFGMKPYTKAFGAVGVTDRLDIWGDIWVTKERGVLQQASLSRP